MCSRGRVGDGRSRPLAWKVRQGGGYSGEGKHSLPSWFLEELESAWRDEIAASLNFTDLSAMISAHEEELAGASSEAGVPQT